MNHLILGSITLNELFEYQKKFNTYNLTVASFDASALGDLALAGAKTFHLVKERDVYTDPIFKFILKYKPFIVTHSNSWGSHFQAYTQKFSELTGRTAKSLEYHLSDLGVDVKVSTANPDKILSIKDLLPIVNHPNLHERHRVLIATAGEFIL